MAHPQDICEAAREGRLLFIRFALSGGAASHPVRDW